MSDRNNESIPLLKISANHKFELTEESKTFLNKLTHPLSIVSIAGLHRSGKSYLLNKLIHSDSFRIGHSTNSVTKGLNICTKPFLATNSKNESIYYIVIDSEGIGSCEKELKYDLKILMLVFLISSTVVYNSVGAIDEAAIEQLSVVLNLKMGISIEKTNFVWILRDFALQLVDKYGKELSAKEYLENCLDEHCSNGDERKKNEIRKAIKENLGTRMCYTLVRPTIKEEELIDLSKCKLRSEFINQIELIKKDIFSGNKADLKRINCNLITGPIFVKLLEEYLVKINSDLIPNVSDIWSHISRKADEELIEKCYKCLESETEKIILPLEKSELKIKLNEIENRIFSEFEKCMTSDQSYRKHYRSFFKTISRVNSELKKSNQQLLHSQSLKSIKLTLRKLFECPTDLSNLYTLLNLHTAEPEATEYVINALCDRLHVVQEQSKCLESQYEQTSEQMNIKSKNFEQSINNLRVEYHEALKSIAEMKKHQEEIEKKEILTSSHNKQLETTLKRYIEEIERKESFYVSKIEDIVVKNKLKLEDANECIKKLREENVKLREEFEEINDKREKEIIKNKVEIVYENKIKEDWNKFDEERKYLKKEIEKNKIEVEKYKKNLEAKCNEFEEEVNKNIREKKEFEKKENEFIKLLKEMKMMHAETKKTYCATYDTFKDNDRIFKSIENIANYKQQEEESIKKKNQKQHNFELKALEESCERRIEEQEKKYTTLIERITNELHEAQETCNKLREELTITNERFIESVSEIEHAKEKERSLYESSLMKLFNNIEQKDYSNYSRFFS